MTVQIFMPKLGFSMSEGILSQWLAEEGSAVTQGQPLYSLESNKAVEEIESPASGKLHIIATPGETYEVGAVLGEIG